MSKEKKEFKNEEICEEKQEARQLTDEDLEQVNGGIKLEIKSGEILGIVGLSGAGKSTLIV